MHDFRFQWQKKNLNRTRWSWQSTPRAVVSPYDFKNLNPFVVLALSVANPSPLTFCSPNEKRTLAETYSSFDLLKLEAKQPLEHQRTLKKLTPIPGFRSLAKTIRNLTRDPPEGKTRTNSRQTDCSLQLPRHHLQNQRF